MDNDKNSVLVDKDIPDFVIKLIEGYSMYNKASIKYWTLIAIVSLLIIVPSKDHDGNITMPLSLGTVSEVNFYPLCFIILSLLLICFGSAFAQAFRISKLMHKAISIIEKEFVFRDQIHLRDITDGLVYPSLTRVAPLAQIAQGKFQFITNDKRPSPLWVRLTTLYYGFLKLIAILVMYCLPGSALIVASLKAKLFDQIYSSVLNIPVLIYYVLLGSSALILVHLFFEDISFIKGIFKKLWKR